MTDHTIAQVHTLASHEAEMPDCSDPDCEFHRSIDDRDDLTTARVTRIPNCDFPHGEPTPALYDAKTLQGPWAYMCQTHFDSDHRGGLGLGIGQKLELLTGS